MQAKRLDLVFLTPLADSRATGLRASTSWQQVGNDRNLSHSFEVLPHGDLNTWTTSELR